MRPEVRHRADASPSAPPRGARRRLRVLVSSGIFPNRVLVNRGIYNLKAATALAATCDVRVVAPVPYLPRFVRARGYEWYAQVPRRDRVGSFEVDYPRYFVTPKVGRGWHGWLLYASVRRHYQRVVREFKPDLILGYFAYPYGFANVRLGRDAGIPVFTFCRGSDIHSIAQHPSHARAIASALRQSSKVFAVSEALKSDIVRLGVDAAHIAVIPNGIEAERFPLRSRTAARELTGLAPDGRYVVCVSRLSHEKGVDLLIDAVALMTARDARFVIVGDGPDADALQARAQRLGVADRIRFVGARPHDEVPAWISSSDVGVLSSRKEGYPNALVEYLACARPAVAARVGGVPEILTSDALGIMVPPENASALAQALDQALARAWDETAIAHAGRARNWQAVAADMQREFEHALGVAHDGARSVP
ncbi:MAG TPA: glycosyltransferase [Candidatus Krumholzibacteria bacterium]|nr:glycosyltransferase [Candidatus Krumholzibacteria bacterium]